MSDPAFFDGFWSIGVLEYWKAPTNTKSWLTSSYTLNGLTNCHRKASLAANTVSENIQHSITPTLHYSDSSLPAEPIISDLAQRSRLSMTKVKITNLTYYLDFVNRHVNFFSLSLLMLTFCLICITVQGSFQKKFLLEKKNSKS